MPSELQYRCIGLPIREYDDAIDGRADFQFRIRRAAQLLRRRCWIGGDRRRIATQIHVTVDYCSVTVRWPSERRRRTLTMGNQFLGKCIYFPVVVFRYLEQWGRRTTRNDVHTKAQKRNRQCRGFRGHFRVSEALNSLLLSRWWF